MVGLDKKSVIEEIKIITNDEVIVYSVKRDKFNLKDLKNKKKDVDNVVKAIVTIDCPRGASDSVKAAVERFNMEQDAEKDALVEESKELKRLIKDLETGQ